MHIIFRADASQKIGSGHIMRCMTLAEAVCRDKSITVEFISRSHLGNMNEFVIEKGFNLHILQGQKKHTENNKLEGYEQWLGVTQECDADETIKIIADLKIDWVIVDHYALDDIWESKVRAYVNNIMVIDDLANRRHNCDLLLDQNYIHDSGRYDNLIPPGTIKLLGPMYALLREEFLDSDANAIQVRGEVKRVFVFFGGADPDNLTSTALRALSKPSLRHLLLDVVIGSSNRHENEVKSLVTDHPNARVHYQVNNIAAIMRQADIAVGAGGATTWERLAIGLPSIVVTIAENQISFTRDLDQDGYIEWLGNVNQVTEQVIHGAIERKLGHPRYLCKQSKKGKELVDGYGANRVSKLLTNGIKKETLLVREAGYEDCHLYYHWLIESAVRKNVSNKKNISSKDHQVWFDHKLVDPNSVMLVIESEYGPVGCIIFEGNGTHFAVDYLITRHLQSHSFEKIILSRAVDYFQKQQSCFTATKAKESKYSLSSRKKNLSPLLVTVLSDSGTWMTPWISELLADWIMDGHKIRWVNVPIDVPAGDLCFILSCSEILKQSILNRNKCNLVVHASSLPKGKGMSPMSWQILEEKNEIAVTLFEAKEELDAGDIYVQQTIIFEGHELLDELRMLLAKATIEICSQFLSEYPEVLNLAYKQSGSESFYPRRHKDDSKLNIDKTLREQFQLLRIVDNEKYPAFFELNGCKYIVRIEKLN